MFRSLLVTRVCWLAFLCLFIVSGPPKYAAAIGAEKSDQRGLRDGLVVHYSFDDDSDGKVYDESGNENHGKTVGMVGYEESFRGRAARFSSNSTYVLSDAPGLNMHGWRKVAVSVWIKTNRITTYGQILNRGEVTGETPSGITLRAGSRLCKAAFTFRRQFRENPPDGERLYSSSLQPQNMSRINKWLHLVGTFDGTFLRFYINGGLDREVECTSDGLHIWDRPDHMLVIGNASNKSRMAWTDKYFDGLVDEVKIWRRGLSESEVEQLYAEGAKDIAKTNFDGRFNGPTGEIVNSKGGGNFRDGVVGHWNFAGDTRDTSGGGHHGSNWPHYAANRFGDPNQAFVGDGSSGRVSVVDHRELDTHDALTLSAWINPREYLDANSKAGCIVSKWYSGSEPRRPGDNGEYLFGLTPKGHLRLLVGNYDPDANPMPNWDQVEGNTVVPLGRWTHVAATFDQGRITLFVNGRLDASGVSHVTSLSSREYDYDDVRVGGNWNASYLFNGLIDDLRIHNRALSDADIVSLHGHEPVRFATYQASRGTLPSEQGFRSIDSDPDNPPTRVENGVLLQGPTTDSGYQYWHTNRIPLDFREAGEGLSAEWKLRIAQSGYYHDAQYAGWTASFHDRHGHAVLVFIAHNRIALHSSDSDREAAVVDCDATDKMRHYRLVVDDHFCTLVVDGKTVITKPLGKPAAAKFRTNRVLFGDWTSKVGSETGLHQFEYRSRADLK